jgi:hypothetical protein
MAKRTLEPKGGARAIMTCDVMQAATDSSVIVSTR